MGFLYDATGITYEGAALVGVIITLLIIGAGKALMQGIKYLRKN